ncbi:MAG: CBS domain-containing protein [Myxococcales bacterium]
MSSKPRTCTSKQTASDAARTMWECDIGSMPVVDDDEVPVGMVTDRDVCMAAYIQGRSLNAIPILDVMSPEVYTCLDSDTVASAERTMRAWQVRRLPVVDDNGRLVGVLSLNDVILARVPPPDGKMKKRALRGLTETMAAICRHREDPSN